MEQMKRRITPFAVSFHSQKPQDHWVRKKKTYRRATGDTARASCPVLRNSTELNPYCESRKDDTAN